MEQPSEREARARAELLAAFESVCPHIVGNPFVPHWPTPPQQFFLGLHRRKGAEGRVFQALYGGAAGGGKALRIDQPIPTPTGWTTVGALKPGDELFDESGRVTRVLQVHATIEQPDAYRLRFDDGVSIECSGEHRWLTSTAEERADQSSGKVRSTYEILASQRTDSGEPNHAIPVAGPLEQPERRLPRDPYILSGALGARSLLAYRAGCVVDAYTIPEGYLRSALSQRYDFLRGVMDAAGTVSCDGTWTMLGADPVLREALVELLGTLGVTVVVRTDGSRWSLNFSEPRSRAEWRPSRLIVAIERAEPSPMRCITVANPSGLFLAGRSFLVTHNSDALLMAAAQYVHHPEYAGIMFRRTHTDLAQPGALMDRAMSWWLPAGASWDGINKIFRFPSGAKIAMAYLHKPNDHLRYAGAEYQFTAWDELTQWPNAQQYEFVGLSRVRRPEGSTIPLRTLSASNPGGPGHVRVMHRFVGGEDPVTGKHFKPEHPYVPARITDNPFLDRESYVEGLRMLHPTVRAQLLDGDWRARDPGDYFRAEWFGPLLDPEKELWSPRDCVRVRWWDLAASEKPGAAFTAGVKMARHRSGVRAVEHCRAFRATPGKRDDLIVQTAQADGHGVVVGLEIEGGSGGPAQFFALEKRLKSLGFRVVGARPRSELTDAEGKVLYKNSTADSSKAARADPVASSLERGHQRRGECPDTGGPWWGKDRHTPLSCQKDGIRLFAGPWTQAYLDVIEGFPEGDTCDEVDATSGAWAWLEAHPGTLLFPVMGSSRATSDYGTRNWHSIHPQDRPPRRLPGQDSAGRWLP